MGYVIKARYYSEKDNFGESYVITSDNSREDTRLEVGTKVELLPMESVEEVRSEVKSDVAKVFDSQPKKEEPIPEKPVRDIIDLTGNNDIGDSAACAASFVFPENCNQCPISRHCPHRYQSDECRQDLRTYFTRPSLKKDKT